MPVHRCGDKRRGGKGEAPAESEACEADFCSMSMASWTCCFDLAMAITQEKSRSARLLCLSVRRVSLVLEPQHSLSARYFCFRAPFGWLPPGTHCDVTHGAQASESCREPPGPAWPRLAKPTEDLKGMGGGVIIQTGGEVSQNHLPITAHLLPFYGDSTQDVFTSCSAVGRPAAVQENLTTSTPRGAARLQRGLRNSLSQACATGTRSWNTASLIFCPLVASVKRLFLHTSDSKDGVC